MLSGRIDAEHAVIMPIGAWQSIWPSSLDPRQCLDPAAKIWIYHQSGEKPPTRISKRRLVPEASVTKVPYGWHQIN